MAFNTIKEEAVTVGGKEFRITVTHITDKGSYIVGMREFTRTEKYTGYSKFNGVSIPAADLESAHTLARTFHSSLIVMASVQVEVANQSAGRPLSGAEYTSMHQSFHGGTPNPSEGMRQNFEPQIMTQGHTHTGLQTFHDERPQNFGSESAPPQSFGTLPNGTGVDDDLPF